MSAWPTLLDQTEATSSTSRVFSISKKSVNRHILRINKCYSLLNWVNAKSNFHKLALNL